MENMHKKSASLSGGLYFMIFLVLLLLSFAPAYAGNFLPRGESISIKIDGTRIEPLEMLVADGGTVSIKPESQAVNGSQDLISFMPIIKPDGSYILKIYTLVQQHDTEGPFNKWGEVETRASEAFSTEILGGKYTILVQGSSELPQALRGSGTCWLDCIGAPHGQGVHCSGRKTWCYVQ